MSEGRVKALKKAFSVFDPASGEDMLASMSASKWLFLVQGGFNLPDYPELDSLIANLMERFKALYHFFAAVTNTENILSRFAT
jgi:hypothetical protein